jgi:hypothetical protein
MRGRIWFNQEVWLSLLDSGRDRVVIQWHACDKIAERTTSVPHGSAASYFRRAAKHVRCQLACGSREGRDDAGRRWGMAPSTTVPRSQRAMPLNRSASGRHAANAMRTRVAVSMIRAATLTRRNRTVLNSALASGWAWEWHHVASAATNMRRCAARGAPDWRAGNGNWCGRRQAGSCGA